MSTTKTKINLDFLAPNSSFIYPLYSENNEKIIDARTILTLKSIKEIKEKYGNLVYYIRNEKDIVPKSKAMVAADETRRIISEILKTDKISKTTYLNTVKVFDEIIHDLEKSDLTAVNLLKSVQSFDDYLYQHLVNVGMLSVIFAKKMRSLSSEEIRHMAIGAFLIDIGTVKIDGQLLKKEGKYEQDEIKRIMRHPQLGYEILKEIKDINPIILQTVLFHHEKFNSMGYYRLPYENLPLYPKIVSACDVFDALTTDRPYRKERTVAETMRILVNLINIQFDYKIVSDFINHVGPLLNNHEHFYARNEFCELNTKEVAMIKEYGEHDMLKPNIIIFCKFEKVNNRIEAKFYKKPFEISLENDLSRRMTRIIMSEEQTDMIKKRLKEKKILQDYF